MTGRGGALPGACLALLLLAPAPSRAADPALPGQADYSENLTFTDLAGWAEDDQAAALAAFLRTCRVRRPVQLGPACRAAETVCPVDRGAARRFFETSFQPVLVSSASHPGFLTGYFEPEYPGALAPLPGRDTPLLTRPPGFVPGEAAPDRAAIETGALEGRATPLVYLDPVDAFMVHVQGSARIRLPDGRVIRVAYAGRNGHAYTSIARALAATLAVPPAALTADRLVAWLKGNPGPARELMRTNRSYIFFRRADELGEGGPVGAAGVPLVAGRSVAIDPQHWSYGLPVWLERLGPSANGTPLPRLVVAMDTGSAIVGAARGDLFVGTGEDAGRVAAALRDPVRFVVLLPRNVPAESGR